MSTLKGLLVFIVLAAIGTVCARFGWDHSTGEVISIPWILAGSLFIALASGVLLILIGRAGLLLIDMLMFPGEKGDPPPALYKLAEWYIGENRYGDALTEYENIAKAHPKEVECWTGMLDVLVTHMGNHTLALKKARLGLRKVKSSDKREQLKAYYLSLTGKPLKAPLFL